MVGNALMYLDPSMRDDEFRQAVCNNFRQMDELFRKGIRLVLGTADLPSLAFRNVNTQGAGWYSKDGHW